MFLDRSPLALLAYFQRYALYTWSADGVMRPVAYLIYSESLFCVPIFFMISGMLLIGRKVEHSALYMKRRLMTVLKPFAFGATFYLIWQITYQKSIPPSVFSYIKNLLRGVPYFHLWFLPALFAMYLLLPLFSEISPKVGRAVVWTAAVLFLIFGVQVYLSPSGLSFGLFNSVSPYLPYFLVGYCLSNIVTIDSKIASIAVISAPIVNAALIAAATAIAGQRAGFVFENFNSPLVVIQSVGIFSLLLRANIPPVLARLASIFAPLSLGIYSKSN